MATTGLTNIEGFAWRTLLGPTHNWTMPQFKPNNERTALEELCPLCGESFDTAKPFITNSAGQQPVHLACSEQHTVELSRPRGARRIWALLLQCFVSS